MRNDSDFPLPFLARLASKADRPRVAGLKYDPVRDVSFTDTDRSRVEATRSLITDAKGDPTSDEATDR